MEENLSKAREIVQGDKGKNKKTVCFIVFFLFIFCLTFLGLYIFNKKKKDDVGVSKKTKIKIVSDIPEYNINFTDVGKDEISSYLEEIEFWEKDRIAFVKDGKNGEQEFITVKNINFHLTTEFQTRVRTGKKPIDMGVGFKTQEDGVIDVFVDAKIVDLEDKLIKEKLKYYKLKGEREIRQIFSLFKRVSKKNLS